mmetsp:Transcript_19898/g.28007  ORF Transcript_19898/g.28007 Transcript_19898/m.28007 type:complete len:205 (-) Transcript_19898:57-671(-)
MEHRNGIVSCLHVELQQFLHLLDVMRTIRERRSIASLVANNALVVHATIPMVTRRRTDDNYTHDTGCDGGDGSGGGGEISHGDESEQDGRPSSSTIHASNGMFHVPIIQEEEGKDAEDHERMMIHRKNATTTSFDLTRLIPAVLAVIGVGIVELNGSAGPPTMGDLLSFAQPIRFGIGYFQLESIMCKDIRHKSQGSRMEFHIV